MVLQLNILFGSPSSEAEDQRSIVGTFYANSFHIPPFLQFHESLSSFLHFQQHKMSMAQCERHWAKRLRFNRFNLISVNYLISKNDKHLQLEYIS